MARYSDFRVNFDVHPIKGDLSVLEDTQSIIQSVKNLVYTDRYERFFDPMKGAGIPQTLFENMSSDTEYLLETRIKEVLDNYEPRIKLVKVTVVTSMDRNAYECRIAFQPINILETITVDAIFKRVR